MWELCPKPQCCGFERIMSDDEAFPSPHLGVVEDEEDHGRGMVLWEVNNARCGPCRHALPHPTPTGSHYSSNQLQVCNCRCRLLPPPTPGLLALPSHRGLGPQRTPR